MKWPKAQRWLEPAGEAKRINASCKIPCDSKDFRIGDGSVLPPTHARSKSYRDAAMQQGGGHGVVSPMLLCRGERALVPTRSLSRLASPILSLMSVETSPNTRLVRGFHASTRRRRSSRPSFAMVLVTRDIMSTPLTDMSGWRY